MNFYTKPIIVTMGEPSGISSEIIIKTWLNVKKKIPPFILVDDLSKLKQVNNLFNLGAKFYSVENRQNLSKIFHKAIPVIDLKANINFLPGKPSKKNSKHVLKSINFAVDMVLNKKASGMLTLPVCKKTLKKSKFNFHGQTEYLSFLVKKKTGISQSEIMILSTSKPVDRGTNLIVGLVTTHIPLCEIQKKINKRMLEAKILSFKEALIKIWRIKKPNIAITSLNPHAGEGGLIGDEEKRIVAPVIKKLKNDSFNIVGPLGGDSCFHKSSRQRFNGILCFYHDQGLIPVKTLDFNNSINVTGGLQFLRVSPDHGPAFDIAEKNVASIDSLVASFDFMKKILKK